MRFRPTIRQVLNSAYYRSNPVAVAKLAYAKWKLARLRLQDPAQMFPILGLDAASAMDGFCKWQPLLEQVINRVRQRGGEQGAIAIQHGILLYGITRALRPQTIIETGVAAGVSTSFFSAALVENGGGRLYSIELPPDRDLAKIHADGSKYDWPEDGSGWAIPREIREAMGDRHRLVLGDVRRVLPSLLSTISDVDVFFHDDLHLPDHMFWEYELVWPRIRQGGILISDDSDFGWVRFCRQHKLPPSCLYNIDRVCAMRKSLQHVLPNADPA